MNDKGNLIRQEIGDKAGEGTTLNNNSAAKLARDEVLAYI